MKIVTIFLLILINLNAQSRFINKKSVVIDRLTSKMWEKNTKHKIKNFGNAKKYCKNLKLNNFSNWRLPHIDELMSIVDKSRYNSTIATTYFTDIQNDGFYWSGSVYKGNKNKNWLIFFKSGYSTYYYKKHKGHILCIRDTK